MNSKKIEKIAQEIFSSFNKEQAEVSKELNKNVDFFVNFVKKKNLRETPTGVTIFQKFIKGKTFKPDLDNNKVSYEDLDEKMQDFIWGKFYEAIAKAFIKFENDKGNKYFINKSEKVVFEKLPNGKEVYKNKAWKIFWKELMVSSGLFKEVQIKLYDAIKNF